jgi:hypothetical protein
MAKYRFKNGILPKALLKDGEVNDSTCNSPLIEEPDEEPQGAFFGGEEATKVIEKQDSASDSFFNPFDDDEEEEKNKSRAKLKAFLGGTKKSRSSDDSTLDEVGEIYSNPSAVKAVEETMDSQTRVNLSEIFGDKKKKKQEDADGENDEYDVESAPIEAIYEQNDDEEDDDDYEDEFTILKKNKRSETREYISPEEKEEFYENYRRRNRKALFSVLSCLVFTLLLFFLESPAFPHPKWLTPGRFGILYLLIDLQLLFLSAICILNRLIRGAKALFKWEPIKNSLTFVLFSASALQIILHLLFDRYNEDIVLFSSIAAFCALVNAIAHFLDVRRETIAFRMAATDSPKYIADSISDDSEEYAFFSEYLPEDPYMYSLSKTKFVSKFVSSCNAPSSFNEIYKIILPLVVFTSVIFSVIANVLAGVPTFGGAIDNFILALMISTPIAALLSVSLPFFKGAVKMSKRGCAVIGEASLDACSSASVISFKDTDVFHEKGIKVTSVKTYGDARIDTAIFTAARVFNVIGGPLKAVFNRSIIDPGSSGASENDTVMQILPSSILSIIDGDKILLGTKNALESTGIDCPADAIDDMFETSGGRIMYMSINDSLAAKFYIKYSLGKNFKAILDSFYDIGICMAVKSCDPNLSTEFLTKLLRDENYPIVVIKLENTDTTSLEKVSEAKPTGIVSNTSIPNMLRSFIWCDKCRRIISLNNMVKFVSLILSVIILIVCLLNANAHEKITPLLVLAYQLIWTLPIFGTSLFQ